MTPSGISIDVKASHLKKASSPIEVTLSGISMEVNEEQCEKVLSFMIVILSKTYLLYTKKGCCYKTTAH